MTSEEEKHLEFSIFIRVQAKRIFIFYFHILHVEQESILSFFLTTCIWQSIIFYVLSVLQSK